MAVNNGGWRIFDTFSYVCFGLRNYKADPGNCNKLRPDKVLEKIK